MTSSIRDPNIVIRAWNERGAHYVEVSDNGVGIPPELKKRIWDPLYTTTSDRRESTWLWNGTWPDFS